MEVEEVLRKREKKERERDEYRKVLDDQVQQVTARRYQEAVPNMEERRYVEERRKKGDTLCALLYVRWCCVLIHRWYSPFPSPSSSGIKGSTNTVLPVHALTVTVTVTGGKANTRCPRRAPR